MRTGPVIRAPVKRLYIRADPVKHIMAARKILHKSNVGRVAF